MRSAAQETIKMLKEIQPPEAKETKQPGSSGKKGGARVIKEDRNTTNKHKVPQNANLVDYLNNKGQNNPDYPSFINKN